MVNRERRKLVMAIRKKYKGKKLPLAFYQEVAEVDGGICLSEAIGDSTEKIKLRCKKYHVWDAAAASIAQGNWCAECQRQELAASKKWTIEMCDAIAKERGGRCITRVYINSKTPMTWECWTEHRFRRKAKDIKKHWCKECYPYEPESKNNEKK